MLIQKIFIASSIIVTLISTEVPSEARSFSIGEVKKSFEIDTLCVALLPNTEKAMLIIPFAENNSPTVFAWLNINGKDIKLKQISTTGTKKKSRSKYQARNISLTVDSELVKLVKEDNSGLTSESTVEKILINYKGQIKSFSTTGGCSY
jgi:hypothetical protein